MRPRPLAAWLCFALLTGLAGTAAPERVARAAAQPPNIVVILTDDQSIDSMSYASPAVMPYLQTQIADPSDHWVRFTNFFFNTPLCCPTRATLLTGLYSSHTHVENNRQGNRLDESSTLATWLDASGFRTGLFGKYLNGYPWGRGNYVPAGWDRWSAFVPGLDPRSTYHYYDYSLNQDGTVVAYGESPADYSTDQLRDQALAFIDSTPSDQPFFVWLALTAPHVPSVPASRDQGSLSGLTVVHSPSFNEADVSDKPAWVQSLRLLSDTSTSDKKRKRTFASLGAVDDAVRSLVNDLQSSDRLDNTIILFLTDNGYSFQEHRFVGKPCAYEQCIRSPFVIRFPGATPHDVTALISSVDVAPTIAELAGVVAPPGRDGSSLVPFLNGPSPPTWRTGVLLRWAGESGAKSPPFWGIRTADYLYVELATGEKELYDLTGRLGPADLDETLNVAGNPAYAGVQATLASQLATLKATAS